MWGRVAPASRTNANVFAKKSATYPNPLKFAATRRHAMQIH